MTATEIRAPAVAGAFYPGDAGELAAMVDAMLAAAAPPALPCTPKALIAPHAGYIYSGPIAASTYALLMSQKECIRRVVLAGPVHRVPVRGLALPGTAAFATPLGTIALDTESMQRISALPQVTLSDAAHAWEHSLEVQLPFLQKVLDTFLLVPLAVGDADTDEVAEVLTALWGGTDTLIVISSDLSHYLPYEDARHVDEITTQSILTLRYPLRHDQACGATPINGLLCCAKQRAMIPHLIDLRNSGDTAGDKAQVVGYCAIAFTEHGHD